MVPSMTPYDLLFPKMGFPYAPIYVDGHISTTGDLIHFKFGPRVVFLGGRQIEWHYFRFEQIQDGGGRHLG